MSSPGAQLSVRAAGPGVSISGVLVCNVGGTLGQGTQPEGRPHSSCVLSQQQVSVWLWNVPHPAGPDVLLAARSAPRAPVSRPGLQSRWSCILPAPAWLSRSQSPAFSGTLSLPRSDPGPLAPIGVPCSKKAPPWECSNERRSPVPLTLGARVQQTLDPGEMRTWVSNGGGGSRVEQPESPRTGVLEAWSSDQQPDGT